MSARARKQKASETEKNEGSPLSGSSTSKSITIEHSRISHSGTPRQSLPRNERSHSPLNISRTEEKDELAHLNNRLADYIDYVRKLELDKDRLTRRIHAVTEERMSKVEEARKTYEDEIAALRNLVDDLAKQKTKAELDAKQAKDAANDAKSKLLKRDQEIRTLNRRIENLEKELANYKQDHDRYQPLLADHHTLEKRLEDALRDLEAETLLRTDLENKVLSFKEQLDFRTRLFDEEREKLSQRTVYIEEEVEDRKKAEYEHLLADELRTIREQTAQELEEYKIQIEDAFETKFGQLRSSADHSEETASRQRSELLSSRKRADELAHDLAKKIAELELLQRRVDDLQRQLDHERKEHDALRQFQNDEISRLKDKLEESFREFTDLLNTKIALDQEILMYRKMLEGEESRLNIQPQVKESPASAPGTKRRRPDDGFDSDFTGASKSRYAYRVSSTSSGSVEFCKEQDTQWKCVKFSNTSTEDASMGNWELVQEVDGQELRFKFHRTLSLKPGATCSVWSGDSDASHNPPTDIVMKNKSFLTGPEITLTLLDADGVEKAKYTVKRERLRGTGVNFGRRTNGRSGSEEKCSFM